MVLIIQIGPTIILMVVEAQGIQLPFWSYTNYEHSRLVKYKSFRKINWMKKLNFNPLGLEAIIEKLDKLYKWPFDHPTGSSRCTPEKVTKKTPTKVEEPGIFCLYFYIVTVKNHVFSTQKGVTLLSSCSLWTTEGLIIPIRCDTTMLLSRCSNELCLKKR